MGTKVWGGGLTAPGSVVPRYILLGKFLNLFGPVPQSVEAIKSRAVRPREPSLTSCVTGKLLNLLKP